MKAEQNTDLGVQQTVTMSNYFFDVYFYLNNSTWLSYESLSYLGETDFKKETEVELL